MTKKGKKFSLKWYIFQIILKKRTPEKFGVPGNIIYKKSPGSFPDASVWLILTDIKQILKFFVCHHFCGEFLKHIFETCTLVIVVYKNI